MATPRKSNLESLVPKGTTVESIVIKATEETDVKAARLFQEKWSFLIKDLAAQVIAYLFVISIGSYCCYVVVRNGVVSQEAKVVLPIITSLFGGVVGLLVGSKAGK